MYDKVMAVINYIIQHMGLKVTSLQMMVLKFAVKQVLKFVDQNKDKWKKKKDALDNLELIEKTQVDAKSIAAAREHFVKESLRL